MDFEALVEEALRLDRWDASTFQGRVSAGNTPWNYEALAVAAARNAVSMLDMGSGGGEVLAEILDVVDGDAPPYITAIEGWGPNIPIARSALDPFGVQVLPWDDDARIPAVDNSFDLVINSHEFYDTGEVARVLQPGGTFLTEQIGGQDLAELNMALGAPPLEFEGWNLEYASQELREAGLAIETSADAMITTTFSDISVVISFIQAVGWQVPGFTIDAYRPPLQRLHEKILHEGPLIAHSHRFLLQAQAPEE